MYGSGAFHQRTTFLDVVFVLHGLDKDRMANITATIKKGGGTIALYVSEQTSFVVSTIETVRRKESVILEAIQRGKPIVSEEFVEECRLYNHLVGHGSFGLLKALEGNNGSNLSEDEDSDSFNAIPLGTSPPRYSVHMRRNDNRLTRSSSPRKSSRSPTSGDLERSRSRHNTISEPRSSEHVKAGVEMSRSRSSDSSKNSLKRKETNRRKTIERDQDRIFKNHSFDDLEVDYSDSETTTSRTTSLTGSMSSLYESTSYDIFPEVLEVPSNRTEFLSEVRNKIETFERILSLQNKEFRMDVQTDDAGRPQRERSSTWMNDLWIGLQAAINGRDPAEEMQALFTARAQIDKILEDVNSFQVQDIDETPSEQVGRLLSMIDRNVESLYASSKLLGEAHPLYNDENFQNKLETMRLWHTLNDSIAWQTEAMVNWVGPIKGHNLCNNSIRLFLMRELKQQTIFDLFQRHHFKLLGRLFDNGHKHLSNKETLKAFSRLKLPSLNDALIDLVIIGGRIISEYLKLRNEHTKKIDEMSFTEVNELLRDLHESFVLSARVHRRYGVELINAVESIVPRSGTVDLGQSILESLTYYFDLLNRKWQVGWDSSVFSVGDMLEEEWEFINNVSQHLRLFDVASAAGFCHMCEKMLMRMNSDIVQGHNAMSFRQVQTLPTSVASGINRLLKTFSWRARRILRFSKKLSSQLEDSTDFCLHEHRQHQTGSLFQALIDKSYSLVVLSDDGSPVTTNNGMCLVTSSVLHNQPQAVVAFLQSVLPMSSNYDLLHENEDLLDGYILLVGLPQLATFSWNGRKTEVSQEIADAIRELPSPMLSFEIIRLVAATSHQLVLMKNKFGRDLALFLKPTDEVFSHVPSICSSLSSLKKSAVTLACSLIAHVTQINKKTPTASPMISSRSSEEISYFSRPIHGLIAPQLNVALPSSTSILLREPSDLSSSSSLFLTPTLEPLTPTTFDVPALLHRFFDLTSSFALDVLKFIRDPQKKYLQEKLLSFIGEWLVFLTDVFAQTNIKDENSVCKVQRWSIKAIRFCDNDCIKEGLINCLVDNQYLKFQSNLSCLMACLQAGFCVDCANVSTSKLRKRHFSKTSAAEEGFDSAVSQRLARIGNLEEQLGKKQQECKIAGKVLENDGVHRSSIRVLNAHATHRMRWERRNALGHGTFGQVYKAINLDTGELMAIKEVKFNATSGSDDVLKSIHEEMSVLERLQDPHVIRYYGMELQRSSVIIFMEYCSEGSLASIIQKDGAIEKESIVQAYAHQILHGLAYLHRSQVVHRDVKPDNILIDSRGALKLADFGSALIKTMPSLEGSRTIAKSPFGRLRGTPNYMSPEIIKGAEADEASDIWSLGCSVWEMVVGKRPWEGLEVLPMMFQIGQVGAPTMPPPSRQPLSSSGLSFLSKCFEINPTARARAQELLRHEFVTDHHSHSHSQRTSSLHTNEFQP